MCVIHVKIMLQSDRSHFAFLYNTEKEELESLEKISAQTKINLSRMIFHLAEIDFRFSAETFEEDFWPCSG